MKSKHTKRALLSSVLALVLCFSMMLGTTFAWFTDSVESTNNIIKAGNLDVEVTNEKGDITGQAELFQDVKLWEPGVVSYENLTVKNAGSLALQYQFCINFLNENTVTTNDKEYGLSSALQVAVIEGPVDKAATNRDDLVKKITDAGKWTALKNLVEEGVLYPVNNMPDPAEVLDAASDKTYTVVIWWEPGEDDNNWNVQNGKTVSDYDQAKNNNYLHIDLGVNLIATQYTYEEDSFDDLYDEDANLPVYAHGEVDVAANTTYIRVEDEANNFVAAVNIPAAAIEEDAEKISLTVHEQKDVYSGVTVNADQLAATYEITVTGIKEGNNETIYVEMSIGKGLTGIEIWHNNVKLAEDDVTYMPETGYVKFPTTSFSPYTVVYDAVAVEEPTVDPDVPDDLPVANVVNSVEYENVDLPWGSYGAWSPTEGLDAYLEAAYTFTCADVEGASESPYANWYCDFVVKLDRDLGANQIFLGGNYGSFGWVGFHNGDLTLEANTEIPLLGSVTSNPWTYEAVAEQVGTFICGVGDVDDALSGATFTVMLRLTNPEDATEFYNVATKNYTFE